MRNRPRPGTVARLWGARGLQKSPRGRSREPATELIHLGQMALQDGATIDRFIDSIFSFPTFAEGYRVAALDILGQRRKRQSSAQAA